MNSTTATMATPIAGRTTPRSSTRSRSRGRRLAPATLTAAFVLATTALTAVPADRGAEAAPAWLDHVNAHRAASNLPPVSEDPTWSSEARAHSCYMLDHGIGHSEDPGLAGYSDGGHLAAVNGNVGVSGGIDDDATFIDRWMSAPFHAIGVLRPGWSTTGYGRCADSGAPAAKSAATLDVLRGLSGPSSSGTPIVFPGPGATVPMTTMSAESPDPVAMCGWTGPVGLPIVGLMPNAVNAAGAVLAGPEGPVETCVLHAGNVSDPYAQSLLGSTNGVIIVPRAPLTIGSYQAELTTSGGSLSWEFGIGTTPAADAQLASDVETLGPAAFFVPETPHRVVDTRVGLGTTRLPARTRVAVAVTDGDAVAVSANIVAVAPTSHGFLSVVECASEQPAVSTISYRPGEVVANQTTVAVEDGEFCLYSLQPLDVVIDVNGVYRTANGAEFVPLAPIRLFDSDEKLGGQLPAGLEQRVDVARAIGEPAGNSRAAVLNVTVVDPAGAGYVKVFPCGAPETGQISSVNFAKGEVRANTVVTPLDDTGAVCAESTATAGLKIDVTGTFGDGSGLELVPIASTRLLDSRSHDQILNGVTDGSRARAGSVSRIQVAGQRGVPADARAVTVNITATDAEGPTFLTAYPCGQLPSTSTVNLLPSQPAASNGATVQLSAGGDLCVFTLASAHVIVDLNAIWR